MKFKRNQKPDELMYIGKKNPKAAIEYEAIDIEEKIPNKKESVKNTSDN